MKTVIKITNDYNNTLSHDYFKEEINYLVNEIDVFCEIRNNSFINNVEEVKRYSSSKEDYKNKTIFSATGYSQSEWQDFTLYHNLKDDNKDLISLINELSRSFTHNNDYIVEKFEQEEINGKVFNSEIEDYTSFCIRHIEFPEEGEVLNGYLAIYGKDFDISIVKID